MKTAMILAAGRGTRLNPLTRYTPKSMCQVQGMPLIEHHVISLARSGYKHIVINHAYLGWKIRDHLGNGQKYGVDIVYKPEPPGGLETGGGIVNALGDLNQQPFLVVNADIFTDFDFSSLPQKMDKQALLIVVNKPDYKKNGDFGLLENGQVTNTNPIFTFAGIALYSHEIFKSCRYGRFSITPILRNLADKQQVQGKLFSGKWIDIGTPLNLAKANEPFKN